MVDAELSCFPVGLPLTKDSEFVKQHTGLGTVFVSIETNTGLYHYMCLFADSISCLWPITFWVN